MGPISPLQKNPARPNGPSCFCTNSASWFGWWKRCFRDRCSSRGSRHKSSRRRVVFLRATEQFVHVLGRRRRVAPLKLHGLPRARQRADGQHAGARVGADEIAHEKIAAMKILEVFVDDKADEQVALRLPLFVRRKFLKRFGEHGIRGPVADVTNQIAFHTRERPRLADGRAALRNNAGQRHVAADRNRHAAVLEHIAVR